MSKKIKAISLCCIFALGISIPCQSLTMNNEVNNEVNNQSSWKEKLFWVLIPVFAQVTIVHLILPLLEKYQKQGYSRPI